MRATTRRRILGLLSFLLGIAGGVLLLRDGLRFPSVLLDILWALVPLALGVLAVVAAFYTYTHRFREGGVLGLVVGLLAILVIRDLLAGAVLLLQGVLALVASPR